MNPDDAREAVRNAAFKVAVHRRAAQIAQDDLGVVIRSALASGISATEVAELAEISRQRVYQIRDGKR